MFLPALSAFAARSRLRMPRHGVARIGLRWLLAAVGWVSVAATPAHAGNGDDNESLAANLPISFSAIGDAPYGDAEVPLFQSHLDHHNLYSTSDFFVHLGDIFSDDETCEEFRYQRMADMLHTLAVPAFVVPGDNEIADCSIPGQAWQWWTQYFMHFEEFYCGTPFTEHPNVRPENFAFVKNGVLFVGIDLVGGGNDTQIMQDDASWVSQQLAAKKPSVRAAVIFAQAGPGSNRSVFFNPFVQAAAAFAKPILYLHGDGHLWIQDRPFAGAQNVLRVQVDRGSLPPVQVTVTLDATNPFVFNRDPWPAGTALYNRPPCADAGPDQSIALSQSATLAGQASDNFVPNNPPLLTSVWTQLGGPGIVTFTDSTALSTQASFSAAGSYPIRLRVDDGTLTTTDDTTVFVADFASDQPPTAANDSTETERDLPVAVGAPGVLANDTDPEGAVLTPVLATAPQHGNVVLRADGSFLYTPAASHVGSDTFTYRASDGLIASNLATVTIRVGIRFAKFTPVADSRVKNTSPGSNYGTSATLRIEQSSTVQHSYLKFAATGLGPVRSATLRLYVDEGSLDGGRVRAVANEYQGTTTPWTEKGINWNNAPALSSPVLDTVGPASLRTWVDLDVTAAVPGNGTFSFGMDGTSTDVAQYEAKEGAFPPQLVVVYLFGSAANAHPLASDDAHALDEDTTLTVASPGVLGNDIDPDGEPLTVTLADSPAGGSVALQPTGGFTYIPATNFSGDDWFTYTVSDGRGGTDIGSVHLMVNPLVDPPVAANDSYTLVVYDSLTAAAPGVLGNDTDPDGDPLFATLVTPATQGTLVLSPNGGFTYRPAPGFIGTDGFTYHVQDPGGLGADATVTIQVTLPPPIVLTFAPVADAYVNSSKTRTNYGTATILQLRDSTTDYKSYFRFVVSGINGAVQSAKLRLFVTDGSPDGGSIHTVSNYSLGTSTPWTETGITWSNAPAIAGAPLASAGSVTVGTWVELNVTASISGNGTICYGTQNANINTAEYASRETPNAPQLVVLVQQVAGNHPPVPSSDSYTLDEDNVLALPVPGVLANDTDPDGDALAAAGGAVTPAHGTLDLHADGSFTYTPQANYNGPDAFNYTASDGHGGGAAANVSLTVNAVNDAPVALPDSAFATAGQILTVPAPGILANDADVEGSGLAAVLVADVGHGTLALDSNGSYTYTPAAGFTGTDSFTYRASDGSAQSADATVTLRVGTGTTTRLPVVFEEMQGGGSTAAATVSTAGALAAVPGHLYVAAIASKSLSTVTSVSGLGLTWTRVRNQCGARAQTGVEVWVGSGTPSAGSVSASFQSAPTNATILVARYSGADPVNPIGNVVSGNTLGTNGVCSGGTDNASFSFNLTTAEGSLVFGGVASRSKTLTPGAGSVKRGQIFQGADTGSMATVSIMDKTAGADASTVVDGTFNGSVDWAVVGVEILPQILITKASSTAEAPRAAGFRVFPNPFTRGTWIEYDLPSPTRVDATVYNARGQRVRTLAAERQVPGRWRLYWDGRNEQGTGVAAGIYFLRAQIGDVLHTRKVVLQR